MRLCCALVSLLGISGAMPGQGQVRVARVFEIGPALGALEDKVGAVPGAVLPADRLDRLLAQLLKRENKAGVGRVTRPEMVAANRQQLMIVQGDREMLDVVQAVLDEMRREPLPRFHLTCTVLVMPWEVAAAHGFATSDLEEADMVTMGNLMRDVVKQKGTLLNLPEVIATPFVPFVAEPRVAAEVKQAPDDAENMRLRGEALAVSPEEAVFGVQLVRGSLPEDRTQLPKAPVFDRVFRLRVGSGVTVTANNGKTVTVLWLRFTGTSTVEPKADKPDKADRKGESGKR